MKTKFFLLLAALLLSVSAFAQSESPLKGDVNNDGTVDVADINAIIEIMKNGGGTGEETKYYFSIGTTPVTAENYTTVNNATTTIPTTQTFWNNSGSKSLIYVLVPSNKTVAATDAAITSINSPLVIDTSVSISNHKVYVTDGKIANGGGIIVTISDEAPASNYYYYAGQVQPQDMSSNPTVDDTNFTVNKWHTLGTATTIAKTITGGTSGNDWYVAVPTSINLKPTATDLSTPDTSWDNLGTITVNGVSYTVWRPNITGKRCAVYMAGTGEETKYYWYVGTTKPTSLSQASTVTSYPAEQTYTNNSGAKSHIFVLTNSNKNVTFIEPNFNSPIDQNEIDTTTIPGYKIFETAVGTANTGSIIIRIS